MAAKDAWRWIYKTARWAELRALRLLMEPLCRYCKEMGKIVPADTVDHVKPHKGDTTLAFDLNNTQSLCKECHDRHAQAKDKGFPVAGCDSNGYPLDPSHAWGKSK